MFLGALVIASVGCRSGRRSGPAERPADDGAIPVSARLTLREPGGTVSQKEPVDRAKAERIGLFYARTHWPRYEPSLATAFNTGSGEYRVVVGFDKRADAASVYVRMTDGQVVDASIAQLDQ
jgi:hypothetical protein